MLTAKWRTRVASHIIIAIFAIISGYPLLWLMFGSLKNQGELYSDFWWAPIKWFWNNYPQAWATANLSVTFFNSIFVTGVTLVLIIVISTLAAYIFARFRFPGKRLIMALIFLPIMVPAQVTFIPLYKLEILLGIYNTRWGLILPYTAGGIALPILILTAYIGTISIELDEAAQIDGCNRFSILWKIIFPLSRPALASVGILTFIGVWNEFFLALGMIQDPSRRTISVAMTYFNQLFVGTDYVHVFAAMSITMLPVILIFVLFQKWFVSGITQGALKL